MTTHTFTPVTTHLAGRRARLNEISSPHEIVAFLVAELQLTQREIAELLGADERTVRRLLTDLPSSRSSGTRVVWTTSAISCRFWRTRSPVSRRAGGCARPTAC